MSAAVERVREALEAHGCFPTRYGSGLHAHCPAHDDRNPSFNVKEGNDGAALVYCHAGCETPDVLARLGLTMADLFEGTNGQKAPRVTVHPPTKSQMLPPEGAAVEVDRWWERIETTYDYHDKHGTLLYQSCRLQPKDFRFRRPDGKGGWINSLGDTHRVLYRLPEVLSTVADGGTIYITEGEKDADAINNLPDAGNIIATCNPGGAGKWKPEYSEFLRGATVVIVADKDEPGLKHARQVADSLKDIAASVRIVEAKEGKDAAEHLAAGFSLDQFVAVEFDKQEPAEDPAAIIAPRDFPLSDAGNGELIASLHSDRLRFDHRQGRWLLFGPHHWKQDELASIHQIAKETARIRFHDAVNCPEDKDRKGVAAWALSSESRPKIEAALHLSRSESSIADTGDGWDADPYLVGVINGVVDLKTGKLRDGRKEDRITKQIPIVYDPDARAPRFEGFLEEVFAGDGSAEMIGFIQRAAGYSLTGCTNEQCLFVNYGDGGNGKTTLLRTLREVLGPYGADTPFSLLEMKGRAQIPEDVAMLCGKRMVTAGETGTTRLNEDRVKALTGDDVVTAAFKYGHQFTYRPRFKLWLSCNRLPLIHDPSKGIWRRVRLIPFVNSFDPKADPKLEATLRAEAPGILALIVRGAAKWAQVGLNPPDAVTAATADYRAASDPLTDFLAECCIIDNTVTERAGRLWLAYSGWADRQKLRGDDRLNNRTFGVEFTVKFTKKKKDNGWWYYGVRLNTAGAALADPPQREFDGMAECKVSR